MPGKDKKKNILERIYAFFPIFAIVTLAVIAAVFTLHIIVGWIVAATLIGAEVYFLIIYRRFKHAEEKKLAQAAAQAGRLGAGVRPVVCNILVDDYIEVMNVASETEASRINAEITRCVALMAERLEGAFRRFDRDKYILFFDRRRLLELEQSRFPILDEARQISTGEGQYITLSIAVGAGENAKQSNEFAQQATDVVLGRGGDQAAVKTEDRITFYGGTSVTTQKRSKVKLRLTSRALRTAIEKSSEVFIMGHARPDMDSMGAAMGIVRCAQFSQKSSRIVLDPDLFMIEPFVQRLKAEGLYDLLVIESGEAKRVMRSDALVVLLDTQRKSSASCPELLEITEQIAVIDHHRRGLEWIENPAVSYLEPYASSTSELVAELVQYYDSMIRLTQLEAEALLSGIAMDTKNFCMDTGVRTFEAATYLRRQGADMVRVRDLLKDDANAFFQRIETIQNMQMLKKNIAIAYYEQKTPRAQLLAAQTADQILTIRGVRASIVLVPMDSGVQVSARSTGDINVQVIMEKLGGGGHLSMAATQLKNMTVNEAKELVQQTVLQLVEEGVVL
ncbi:MAG: DHH family phosphoesterase [Bacillota bacterium]